MSAVTVPSSEDILRSKLADVRARLTRFEKAAMGGSDTSLNTAIDDVIDSLWAVQKYRSRTKGQWTPGDKAPTPSVLEMHHTGRLPVWVEDARDNG